MTEQLDFGRIAAKGMKEILVCEWKTNHMTIGFPWYPVPIRKPWHKRILDKVVEFLSQEIVIHLGPCDHSDCQ